MIRLIRYEFFGSIFPWRTDPIIYIYRDGYWGQNLWGPQKFPPPKASLPFDGVESSCNLKHAKAALGSVRNPSNWGLRLVLGALYVCLLQEFKVSPFRSSGCCLFFLVADPPKNVTVSLKKCSSGVWVTISPRKWGGLRWKRLILTTNVYGMDPRHHWVGLSVAGSNMLC